MADVNSFSFTGRLTKDAEVKTINGKTLLQLSVANNIGYGDFKKTNWLTVKMWGDKGANIAPIMTKGALIGGAGELSTNEWTGRDGQTHINIEVTTFNVQLLSKPKDSGSSEAAPEAEYEDTTPVF